MTKIKTNIILIGFMGTGKTSIGKNLAIKTDYSFLDLDEYLELNEGKSIKEIFAIYGEEYFRKLETKYVNEISKLSNHVIATGGGVVNNLNNIETLKKSGKLVYLKSTPSQIYENIKDDNSRPLLETANKLQTITDLLLVRDPIYLNCADFIIEIKDVSLNNASNCIINLLASNNFFNN